MNSVSRKWSLRWRRWYLKVMRPGVMCVLCLVGIGVDLPVIVFLLRPGLGTPIASMDWGLFALVLFQPVILAVCAFATFSWERYAWSAGGHFLTRSVQEAMLIVEMTPDEEEEFLLASIDSIKLAIPLTIVGAWLYVGSDMIVFLGMCSFFFPVYFWLSAGGPRRANALKVLARTERARRMGISAEDLAKPWYRAFLVADYYQDAIADLDSSPFEDDAR